MRYTTLSEWKSPRFIKLNHIVSHFYRSVAIFSKKILVAQVTIKSEKYKYTVSIVDISTLGGGGGVALTTLKYFCLNTEKKVFCSIWNHHKCLSQLQLNAYVMGLLPLYIYLLVLSESEVRFWRVKSIPALWGVMSQIWFLFPTLCEWKCILKPITECTCLFWQWCHLVQTHLSFLATITVLT